MQGNTNWPEDWGLKNSPPHSLVNVATCFAFTECKDSDLGNDFRGTSFTTTVSGRVCQRWDSDSPHDHGFNVDPAKMEAEGLEGLKSSVTLYFASLPPFILFHF